MAFLLFCRSLRLLVAVGLLVMPSETAPATRWCDLRPRPGNKLLPRVDVHDDWFEVYRVGEGVFAICEPFQFQEVISYLILGSRSALLFDTGLGIGKISGIVSKLTSLPVTVLNSHTHFDHVGGNADFARILAMDTDYTRANARGFSHEMVQGEVEPAALCHGLPAGFDPAGYRTRSFTPTQFIKDGHIIDLGERRLTVLHVPGHAPDAVALVDAAAALLFTGDSFYEGTIWLYVPETDLTAFAASVDRMAAMVPNLKALHPAHNVAVSGPEWLSRLEVAVGQVRSGQAKGVESDNGQITFSFEGFRILTSRAALAGGRGDPARGGSGLDVAVSAPVADHHQHLFSSAIAALISAKPVSADDLVTLLDAAGIERAAVLSVAYMYGNPARTIENEYEKVKAENDWTGQQVARFPDRLRGFCSFNPLRDYALAELARCAKDPHLRHGLKLHFGNSIVDYHNAQHVERLRRVFRAANEYRMPIVVHMRASISRKVAYGRDEARVFLNEIVAAAPDVPIQIAHLAGAGGYADPLVDQALAVFVEAIEKGEPRAERLYFDVTTVALPDATADQAKLIATRIRQLGVRRVLYGSDAAAGTNLPPREGWAAFRKLPLTNAEFQTIAGNVPPYMR
jgi:glyoxylase-like metal-dependent hydrolase (beta-lactamase superfamily II)/predicted TIM-barrel fold metal-dependent hydrolase